MATTNPDVIRVVAYKEGEMWVAQCLEFDISAQGSEFQTAMRRLTATVNAECRYTRDEHGAEFAGIDPAPSIFEQMFNSTDQSLKAENLEWRIAA